MQKHILNNNFYTLHDKNVIVKIHFVTQTAQCKMSMRGNGLKLASVGLTVIMLAERFILGDVGVQELKRVLGDDTVCNNFIVPYDISDGKSTEAAFGVRLH